MKLKLQIYLNKKGRIIRRIYTSIRINIGAIFYAYKCVYIEYSYNTISNCFGIKYGFTELPFCILFSLRIIRS